MAIPSFPLTVREFDGDEWPDKRVSLSSGDYAVMISPRYASIDKARVEAKFIADAVNAYSDSLSMVDRMRHALEAARNSENSGDLDALIEESGKYLEDNAFDRNTDSVAIAYVDGNT